MVVILDQDQLSRLESLLNPPNSLLENAVYDQFIYRMKKVFQKGQVFQAQFYTISSLEEQNEPEGGQEEYSVSETDRNQQNPNEEDKKALIF